MKNADSRRPMNVVTLPLSHGRALHLVLDGDVRSVRLQELPSDSQLVLAIDSSRSSDCELTFDTPARAALGERVWATFFDAADASQRSEDLLLAAYLASGLLDRGQPVFLCVSAIVGVELLAAAVLLVRGLSQPAAIAKVQELIPNAFPEIDDEIALAAIDETHRARTARAADNGVRNSL